MAHVLWIVPGGLDRKTGGAIYDCIIVDGLSARGFRVDVNEPTAEPDVIVGDELAFRRLLLRFRAPTRAARVLLIHHLTCWEEDGAWAEGVEQSLLDTCDLRITTSAATRDRIGRDAIVIEPGCDRLARRARSRDDDRVRFLFVGAAIARKRLDFVQRAAAEAGVELACVGKGTPRGVVSDGELAQQLADADALVSAATLEGYGIAVAEALRAGLPVIATRGGAAPGLLTGDEALVVDDGDLAGAMARFAADPALREQMRLAARRKVLPRWADAIEAFSSALLAVTARRRAARA